MIKKSLNKQEAPFSVVLKYSEMNVIKVASLGDSRYLVCKLQNSGSFSCKVPNNMHVTHTSEGLKFTSLKSVPSFARSLFDIQLKLNGEAVKQENYRMRVRMVGLGFKCYKAKDLSVLRIRAGFSHLIDVVVPKCIVSVKPSKSAVVIESVDKTALGNFVNKILRVFSTV